MHGRNRMGPPNLVVEMQRGAAVLNFGTELSGATESSGSPMVRVGDSADLGIVGAR